MLTISASIFVNLLWRLKRADRVLVVTNPPLLPYLTALACKLRGAKYYLLVHDVYPEVLIVTGVIANNSIAARLGRWFSRQLYHRAERIIVLGRDMKNLVLGKVDSARASRVVTIPNWADIDLITPEERDHNPLLHAMGLREKFVILYSGNMGRTHGLETIVSAAGLLRSHEELQFVLCGSGAKRKWLEETVSEHDHANIMLLQPLHRGELSNLLNACDVALISFMPGMAGVSVPSRMYNILAAGKPIIAIADHGSELALVIEEEEIGWVVPPEQPERLAEVIYQASLSKEILSKMGERARAAAEKKYSLQKILEVYRSLVFLD